MIGGFLGSGKTTSVLELAGWFRDQGKRVGLITNDQGRELVDTAMLRSRGFATEEISGGCFCCRFNSLTQAADKLTAATRPDVFIAEPVGSCTDLIATVSYPLRRLYGNKFTVAPLSVLVDPIRAERILGLESGRSFSAKVSYIYRKQLEEADLIVINKCDLLSPTRLDRLQAALLKAFQHAEILQVSARHNRNLNSWFDQIARRQHKTRPVMPIDYEIYAEGEAELGWLNATVQLSSPAPFDANALLSILAKELQNRLQAVDAEVAHLKMTFSPSIGLGDIAVVNLVRNDYVPELTSRTEELSNDGQLIINLRAQAQAQDLADGLQQSLKSIATRELTVNLDHLEHFQPAKPQPTHRDTAPVGDDEPKAQVEQ